jgi:uncharacterized protein YndB with AHSA1/START domain
LYGPPQCDLAVLLPQQRVRRDRVERVEVALLQRAQVDQLTVENRLPIQLHGRPRPGVCDPRLVQSDEGRVASASREVRAPADRIFELITDPSRHPEWDGNNNLAEAAPGQRVRAVGDVFSMTLTKGSVRENHIVEFAEGRLVAWKPAEPGQAPIGQLWRWEVEPIDEERSLVVHTYDWTDLQDESRYERARATTSERLAASIDRLATLVEKGS